ncbi:Uncharacterised protein [Serratia marcescens]|nr:Uncharacterised protein [Serratia marcescens]
MYYLTFIDNDQSQPLVPEGKYQSLCWVRHSNNWHSSPRVRWRTHK